MSFSGQKHGRRLMTSQRYVSLTFMEDKNSIHCNFLFCKDLNGYFSDLVTVYIVYFEWNPPTGKKYLFYRSKT